MKKIGLLLLALGSGVILIGCSSSETVSEDLETQIDIVSMKPEVAMDIYGKIMANEGNEFTIQIIDTTQDPTFGMTQEEKQAYKATLTDEQKMAEKEALNNAILGEEKIIIPVGIPVSVKLEQGAEAPEKMGSLVDLTVGSYISVWYNTEITDRQVAIYVKKSFTK